MIDGILQTLGTKEKDHKIIRRLVELGPQPASHIAKLCSLPRNTTRSILDSLVERGIVTKTLRGRTQFYALESSENIIRKLKTRKVGIGERIDSQIEAVKQHSEEWDQHKYSKTRPKIKVYEGQSGLERVYEDTLTAKTGLKSWADYDSLYEGMEGSAYFPKYFTRRANAKIPMQSIHPMTKLARDSQKKDCAELRESALVPTDKFNWKPEIQVYDNKVNITSWQEKLGIIIESEEIAHAVNAIFDLAYEAAQKYGYTTKLP
jgi:HTH-type transcriptional regulator, sugar sensing transcriptional regulator